jgi:enoyl-CoA hydratase/carnithine racemase
MSTRLQTAINDHVAEVALNRPEKHNAVDMAMFDELGELGASLGTDRSVRAVVLRGSGENFCAGIDLDIFSSSDAAIDGDALAPLAGTPANRFQRAAYVWRELPVPVICAIEGVAFGAGLQIALGADLRYGTADAKLSIMEVRWGLIPDLSITVTTGNLVREDRLRELAYTGRVVSGREALEYGLLTAIHDDPVAAARKTAGHIAAKSPDAIRAMKKMFNKCRDLDESRSLALEAALQADVLRGANQREAVAANMAGREPDFEN